jgi:hypothetical protein
MGSHFIRRNHYTRPLEEAIHFHQSQWPKAWEGKNPLHGGRTFATMSPAERVRFQTNDYPRKAADPFYFNINSSNSYAL